MENFLANNSNSESIIEDEVITKVIPIEVPKEVDYIGNWPGFEYPQGHLILDKTICGCGFTEFCLTNNIPTIICSPRKTLLNNKKKQHPEDNVYYFKNEYSIENYDSETIKKVDVDERKDYLMEIKGELLEWVESGYGLRLFSRGYTAAPKILVTYDSLHHVLDALGKVKVDQFSIVVDEFQSIFMDATFKADVELGFIDYLKECKNVLYLSATPMLDKYMNKLDYFKDLDFYKLIWDESRVETIRIERKYSRSINNDIAEYIERYRTGKYPTKMINEDKYESKELVIFVNSVKSICDIIKKCKLTLEETNIICADTEENRMKLKKVGHIIGDVPVRGEQHKMFTLCTRTVYLGSDFYSPSAYTIIVSDANIKTLTVDISLDLPQIVGRQRLQSNVFRNEVLFLYKTINKNSAITNITEEEYQKLLDEMEENTQTLLSGYSKMTEREKKEWSKKARRDNNLYMDDFLGVSSKTGKATYNYLVKIAKQRAFDVTRKDYQDNVTIKRCIEEREGQEVIDFDECVGSVMDEETIINVFKECFNSTGIFKEKMKMLCSLVFLSKDIYERNKIAIINIDYQYYMDLLGPERIRALDYEELKIQDFIKVNNILSSEKGNISKLFELGKIYSRSDIKDKLKDFYIENKIEKSPKAVDILNYFEADETTITNKETGKREKAFKILSIK